MKQPLESCPEPSHSETLQTVRQAMPDLIVFERRAERYRLLSDPSRLQLLFALAHGELCGCDLSKLTGQSKYAISHQLRNLRSHGLVRSRRAGAKIYYRLDQPSLIRRMKALAKIEEGE